jgi:holo-[acyl-carrier protein] synthase
MIHGIGTDIVAVKRLQGMWERHGERVLEKLLAPQEVAEFAHAAVAAKGRFLAKRFAAKEAFCKALGTGVRPPAVLPAIAVGHDDLGKPVLAFRGQLAELIENQGLTVHVSLSDEAEYAIASVILERP